MPTVEDARAWYPSGDPVHGFDHIIRVYTLAERIAEVEGADLEIVRAAVLLHDARGGETGGEGRAEHQQQSAEFAAEILIAEGWTEERIAAVQHCIRAHRFRGGEEAQTLEAKVVFDADKLDVIGAFGVARTIAYDAIVGQPIFAEPSEDFRQRAEKVAGESHSSYHEFLFKLSKVKDKLFTPTAIRIGEQRHIFLVEFFEQLAAEARGVR